ncbi:MAG TPA: DUF5939 domain-containing protein [Candidatus Baltobacteraceae bacterium]|nr:DUF5939 domain-containing protein [Candidatus Baltobacteraceae bacterium]
MKTFEERSSFASAATPDAVWRALCASGAFERDGSFPDAAYEKSSAGDDILVGRASLGPLPVEWEEPAWSWDPPHRFSLERRFRSGPFARYASETTIAPEGDGARIDQAVELEASGALGTLIAPLVLMRRRAVASAAIAEAVALAERGDAAPPAASAATVTRFVDAFDAVRPHGDDDVAVATHLAAHAEGSPDAVLAALRPFALADAWGLPRERVAAAMLAAARAGLLDLRWQVTCEACGGRCAGAASLAALPRDARCAACNATCAVALDRSVEAVFDARGGERDDGVLRPAGPSATTAGEPRATAAYVTALQAFRDLFPDDAVAADTVFPLRDMTLLFTDVAGATALYAEFGDARATALIGEQHAALHDVAALFGGAVVKTMGDGAMAVFAGRGDAARAALAFVAASPLPARAGAHAGPCVALRANGRLDYGGASVGLAARLARVAAPGELLLSAALAADPNVRDGLDGAERGTLTLRGMRAPLDVVRVRARDAEA